VRCQMERVERCRGPTARAVRLAQTPADSGKPRTAGLVSKSSDREGRIPKIDEQAVPGWLGVERLPEALGGESEPR